MASEDLEQQELDWDYFYENLMCFLELDSYNSLIDLFCIPLMIYFHGFGNSDSENWKHVQHACASQ